jgi:hypothetical protein
MSYPKQTSGVGVATRLLTTATNIVSNNPQVTLGVGQTAQLSPIVADANGDIIGGATFSYTSAAPSVATVSGGGLVTGVGAGSTTLAITSAGLPSVNAQVTVSAANFFAGGAVTYSIGNFWYLSNFIAQQEND